MGILSDETLTKIHGDACRDYAEQHPDEWGYPLHVPLRAAERAALLAAVEKLREMGKNAKAMKPKAISRAEGLTDAEAAKWDGWRGSEKCQFCGDYYEKAAPWTCPHCYQLALELATDEFEILAKRLGV